jgi:uncharacterized lipoprotein YddW (UPF0748 family)
VTFRPRSSSAAAGVGARAALACAAALWLALAGVVTVPAARAADFVADTTRVPLVSPEDAGPIDYLWVLRTSLMRTEDVPLVVARAKAMGVRGLLVQVIGRGDAWYRSDRLPVPEPLIGKDRDPLGEILPLAHAAGLEVHAWINCCLVWSAPKRPVSPMHVLNTHPEWVARLADGRPMTRLTPRQRERVQVEGVFLSPAHPGVRTWIAQNVREIALRYPVDGIHLDYIRNPTVAIGYDPTSRARFALESGVDPLMFSRQPAAERARLDSAWAAFQLEQVTAIVREVRDTLQIVRPGVPLSAAVVADSLTAWKLKRQPWGRWVRDGLLDRAYLMCYAPVVQVVLQQLASVSQQVGMDRLVPGIAMYNAPLSAAAAKIKAARAMGFPAVALYSYDSLYDRPGQWDRLRGYLADRDLTEVRP